MDLQLGYFAAVGGTTGIDYSQPRHTQYVVNKDNQVVLLDTILIKAIY